MNKKTYNTPNLTEIEISAKEILLVSDPELPLDPFPGAPGGKIGKF